MRFGKGYSFRKMFAGIPHRCSRCFLWVWLEPVYDNKFPGGFHHYMCTPCYEEHILAKIGGNDEG